MNIVEVSTRSTVRFLSLSCAGGLVLVLLGAGCGSGVFEPSKSGDSLHTRAQPLNDAGTRSDAGSGGSGSGALGTCRSLAIDTWSKVRDYCTGPPLTTFTESCIAELKRTCQGPPFHGYSGPMRACKWAGWAGMLGLPIPGAKTKALASLVRANKVKALVARARGLVNKRTAGKLVRGARGLLREANGLASRTISRARRGGRVALRSGHRVKNRAARQLKTYLARIRQPRTALRAPRSQRAAQVAISAALWFVSGKLVHEANRTTEIGSCGGAYPTTRQALRDARQDRNRVLSDMAGNAFDAHSVVNSVPHSVSAEVDSLERKASSLKWHNWSEYMQLNSGVQKLESRVDWLERHGFD